MAACLRIGPTFTSSSARPPRERTNAACCCFFVVSCITFRGSPARCCRVSLAAAAAVVCASIRLCRVPCGGRGRNPFLRELGVQEPVERIERMMVDWAWISDVILMANCYFSSIKRIKRMVVDWAWIIGFILSFTISAQSSASSD